MTWLTDMMKQTAVYWGAPSPDGYGGATFASPVELSVRWSQRQELFGDRTTGREVVSDAVVYLSQAVDRGGWLYLGSLNDIASGDQSDPQKTTGAREIKGTAAVPDIENSETLYKAFLRG